MILVWSGSGKEAMWKQSGSDSGMEWEWPRSDVATNRNSAKTAWKEQGSNLKQCEAM